MCGSIEVLCGLIFYESGRGLLRGRGLWFGVSWVIFEEPVIEIRFELSAAKFSLTNVLSPNVSMKAFTSDQSTVPSFCMKRFSLKALNGVILSGGRNASLVPIIASGEGT